MKAVVAILGLDSHWRGSVLVARLLRERGLRLTPQRRAVVAALSEFEGHVSAAVERILG